MAARLPLIHNVFFNTQLFHTLASDLTALGALRPLGIKMMGDAGAPGGHQTSPVALGMPRSESTGRLIERCVGCERLNPMATPIHSTDGPSLEKLCLPPNGINGVRDEDFYREINLSPSQAWQAYQFEEYRYPEDMPPQPAYDIDLVQLKRTHYGMNVSLDLTDFMNQHKLKWSDLFIGLSAVLKTSQGEHYYAMQHSSSQADFHNKRDWLHVF